MYRIYLNEFNVLMGKTTYFPLVSGLLRAFSETRELIVKNYKFMPFLFHMESPESILEKYQNPSVAAFSVCMWNEQLNLKIAKEVKRLWPNCLIIFGGPQVPHNPKKYFNEHPFIDVSVRGEGEEPFARVLERYVTEHDFSQLAGVSWRNPSSGEFVYNAEEHPFRRDLDHYPSPYLEGLYEELIADYSEINFQAIIETNRGCPFLCTFCYWGKGGLSRKYRYHGLDRTFRELEWCSKQKIQYVFNADSNFGMHRRDRQIAEKLVELKTSHGFPEKFRTCYGKNTDEKIFQIGALFHKHGIEKGITLSRQSLNENTLKIIKRDNIKLEVYSNLQRNFNDLDVPVYCELILGLPGETFASWVVGIESLLETGIKNQIYIYLCQIYNNTELADPVYRGENGIISRKIEMKVVHADVNGKDRVTEIEEVIVGTKTMPVEDWRRAAKFSWTTMLLHSMKIGFYLMGYLRDQFGLAYTDLIQFISDREFKSVPITMMDQVLDSADELLAEILSGKGRAIYDSSYGEIYWEFEEMSFLHLSQDLDRFYNEFEKLLQGYLEDRAVSYDEEELREAVIYQKLRIPTSQELKFTASDFEFNFPEFFERRLSNSPVELRRDSQRLWVEQTNFNGDREKYAREVILWGRKSGLIERIASWQPLKKSKQIIAAE